MRLFHYHLLLDFYRMHYSTIMYMSSLQYIEKWLYIGPMKKAFSILLLWLTSSINAQKVDLAHFDEDLLNDFVFSKMSDYACQIEYNYLDRSSIGERRLYHCIRKNHNKISLDYLNEKINKKILRSYESIIISKTNLVGNVGLLDSISCRDITTYQEIADRCLSDWLRTEDAIFLNWGRIGEAIAFYDKKNNKVFILFAYFE